MEKQKTKDLKVVNYSPGKSLNVRLRGKKLTNGSISLYLDYYQGYTRDDTGKISTKRKVEYLKIYLIGNPKTHENRKKNDEALALAQAIRNIRESDLQHKAEGLIAPYRKKSNFFDYCQAFLDHYQKKDIRMVKAAIEGFKSFTGERHLTPIQLDQTLIKGYRDFLLNKYNGETPNSIFARFKKILNAATEDGLFVRNPAEKIRCKIPDGIPKEILTSEEVLKLASADCSNPEIKRAFLLSLYTGLRFVDIKDLKHKHITNGLIKKAQQKTGREVIIDLNPSAIKLIGEKGNQDKSVFNLPSFNGCLKSINSWAKKAGIGKHLTWHTARHSFATILLMNQTNIKTVQSLLGHSKIEHTQKYTHVVDRLKTLAVNTLPELPI
jgi:integrase/recombinase XerD